MIPDTSDWAGADLRWAAGYGEGLWKDFADEAEAEVTGNWLADLGWTVTIRPMGEDVEVPPNVLLSGIVGSVAYGLDTEASDIDRLGMFAAPTGALVSLHPPKPSMVSTAPDATFHEAGKFAALALRANPTITELMWLPDDLYEVETELGRVLISIRHRFLSRAMVRNAYLGYATQQFRKLEARGDGSFSADTRKRTAKHARHLARLLNQGLELFALGTLTVRLSDPGWYRDFGERVAAGDLEFARQQIAMAEEAFSTAKSPLPEKPDERTVEAWLREVRHAHYERAA
jgi:hypothetical protein